MNKVAVVILNFNGSSETLTCLDSLERQDYRNYEIILIDNGSRDNSCEVIDSYLVKHPKLSCTFIKEHKNHGFAGGVNIGINWAIKNKFDLIALINNDVIVDKYWLKNTVKAINQEKTIGIATGLLVTKDGKKIDSTGDFYSIWGLPFPRNRGDAIKKTPESGYVFGATGGASLYKTKLFQDIGLFDEDFFAYYEDVDISFRSQLAGWKAFYVKDALAYHNHGTTSKKIPGFSIYQTFKNLPILYTKNVPDSIKSTIGKKFHFAYFMILCNAIRHGDGKPALKGFYDSIKLSSESKNKRIKIQSAKTASDNYIKDIMWPDLPPNQTGLRKMLHPFIKAKK